MARKAFKYNQCNKIVTCRQCNNFQFNKGSYKYGMCLDIDDLKHLVNADTKRVCKFFREKKEEDF